MYKYDAMCLRVVDGDTIKARVDLGFHIWVEKTIRIRGIDCPEVRTKNLVEKRMGIRAKGRVVELLEENEFQFKLISHSLGKYGRVVGDVILPQGDLGEVLIAEGHAERYEEQ
jgi:micrococcal nuclease